MMKRKNVNIVGIIQAHPVMSGSVWGVQSPLEVLVEASSGYAMYRRIVGEIASPIRTSVWSSLKEGVLDHFNEEIKKI